jgi:hypothetical protein
VKHRRTIVHDLVGPVQISQKAYQDTLHQACVFASVVIYRSRSGFSYVQAVKRRRTIFMLGWSWRVAHKQHAGTRYVELLFLHSVQSTGHVVHYGASEARNVDTLFLMPVRAPCGSHRRHVETRCTKLVSLHLMRSVGHVVYSVRPGRQTLMHYFSCLCGPCVDPIKSAPKHVTMNLCFYFCWDLRVM